MTSIEPRKLAVAKAFVDAYLESAIEGVVVNAEILEASPGNADAGRRVRAHLIDIERFATVREALASL